MSIDKAIRRWPQWLRNFIYYTLLILWAFPIFAIYNVLRFGMVVCVLFLAGKNEARDLWRLTR